MMDDLFFFPGSVIWSVVKTVVSVVIIGVCICLCCWCCKKRKTKNYQMTISPAVVYHVPQPAPPPECQPFYPGYQPVPSQPAHSMSTPPALPSYQEATLCHMNPPVDNSRSLERKPRRKDLQV